jgi:hypothetical protein
MSEKTRPTIVCLCGSSRFREAFEAANRRETSDGKIVLSLGMFGHHEGLDMDGPVKAMLDDLHFAKIDLADELLIVSKDGYFGKSTRREIEYALSLGKPVRWQEDSARERFYGMAQGETPFGGDEGQDEGSPRRPPRPAPDGGDQSQDRCGAGRSRGAEAAKTPEGPQVERVEMDARAKGETGRGPQGDQA